MRVVDDVVVELDAEVVVELDVDVDVDLDVDVDVDMVVVVVSFSLIVVMVGTTVALRVVAVVVDMSKVVIRVVVVEVVVVWVVVVVMVVVVLEVPVVVVDTRQLPRIVLAASVLQCFAKLLSSGWQSAVARHFSRSPTLPRHLSMVAASRQTPKLHVVYNVSRGHLSSRNVISCPSAIAHLPMSVDADISAVPHASSVR